MRGNAVEASRVEARTVRRGGKAVKVRRCSRGLKGPGRQSGIGKVRLGRRVLEGSVMQGSPGTYGLGKFWSGGRVKARQSGIGKARRVLVRRVREGSRGECGLFGCGGVGSASRGSRGESRRGVEGWATQSGKGRVGFGAATQGRARQGSRGQVCFVPVRGACLHMSWQSRSGEVR